MDKLGIPLYLGLQTVNFNKEKDKYFVFWTIKTYKFYFYKSMQERYLSLYKGDLITSRVTFELMIFGKNCSHKIVLPDT